MYVFAYSAQLHGEQIGSEWQLFVILVNRHVAVDRLSILCNYPCLKSSQKEFTVLKPPDYLLCHLTLNFTGQPTFSDSLLLNDDMLSCDVSRDTVFFVSTEQEMYGNKRCLSIVRDKKETIPSHYFILGLILN